MSDAIYLQDLILFSSCIIATLIVFSPFGRHLIPEYGFREVHPAQEPLLFLRILSSTPMIVCRIILVHHILVFTKIPDLTPFWDSQTTYWKSARAKTSAFKYSYPEFDGLDLGKPDAVKTAIHYYVESHYGSGGGASRRLLRAGPSTEGVQAQEASNVINYWSTRIHVKKFELSGSFSVLIFLGEVPDDPEQWCTSSSFVGAHNAFVNSATSQCDNCRSQADLVVEGFVHLTSAIEKKSLPSYEPSVVRSYLKDNLTWRILTVRVFHS